MFERPIRDVAGIADHFDPYRDQRPMLSVVAPCYNEEAVLPEFVARVGAVLDGLGHGDPSSAEIVLVDDGSRDGTWAAMTAAAARDSRVVAVQLMRNHGHQLALTAGLSICRGERDLTVLLGPNGGGKTTTVKLALGGRYEDWSAYEGNNYSTTPALNVNQPEISASTRSSAVRPCTFCKMRFAASRPAASGTGCEASITSICFVGAPCS